MFTAMKRFAPGDRGDFGMLRYEYIRIISASTVTIVLQLISVNPANAWELVLNCVNPQHVVQVGIYNLDHDAKINLSPGTVKVVCLAANNESTIAEKTVECPAAESQSMSIRWLESRVEISCKPLATPRITPRKPETPETTTEDSGDD